MSDGPRDLGERPSGGVRGVLWEYTLQMNVGRNHALAEGYEFKDRSVLRGYRRTEHPWIHRLEGLWASLRGWWA